MGVILSSKLRDMGDGHGGRKIAWYCPGCDMAHAVNVDRVQDNGAGPWGWNGDTQAPSFTPSVDVDRDGPTRCHSIITNGVIAFCSDSKHTLAGKSVPMSALPWWLTDEDPPDQWFLDNGITLEDWRRWYPLVVTPT